MHLAHLVRSLLRGAPCRLPAAVCGLLLLAPGAPLAADGPRWRWLGPAGAFVWDIAVAPRPGPPVYAAVPQTVGGEAGALLVSRDGGEAWREVDPGGFDHEGVSVGPPYLVTVDPIDPDRLHCKLTLGTSTSSDAGDTWSGSLPGKSTGCMGRGTALLVAPSSPSRLYASGGYLLAACGISGLCAVFRSDDAGETWSCIGSEPEHPRGLAFAEDLAVDPHDAERVYAASTGEGVWKSTDGGESWRLTASPTDVTTLAIDPLRSANLFAGTEEGGVFKSGDAGATWRAAGPLPAGKVLTLAIDPVSPENVYATVEDRGVFRSRDGGASWQEAAPGLPADDLWRSLAVDPVTPSVLYAGSIHHGVFRLDQTLPGPCRADGRTLCLGDGRFEVRAGWKDGRGGSGVGSANPVTPDSGSFWFFAPENLELTVKVLDGRGINGHFWVFYASLSDVEYTLVVRDTVTGEVRGYENPRGRMASRGDTGAFPLPVGGGGAAPARSAAARPAVADWFTLDAAGASAGCVPGDGVLCLGGGRFRVEVEWQDGRGGSGIGHALPATPDTGYFWFFDRDNIELSVKVLDGRPINQRFWVFYGSLSEVAFTLRVTDTRTGVERSYENPLHHFESRGDTSAFVPGTSVCAGLAGIPCAADETCDLDAGFCRGADIGGACVPRPEVCNEAFLPVCGCDGKTYSNDCERLVAGVAKDHNGACAGPRPGA